MPDDLRDLAQRVESAFNERDLEAWFALSTEDFSVRSRFSSVANTVFRGRDGVRNWWADLDDAWELMTVDIQDVARESDDRAVVLLRLTGHGRGSGVRLDEPVAHVWELRDGRLASLDYMDRDEAERVVRSVAD